MLNEKRTRNVGLLINGGKKIWKTWRHARGLETRTRRNIVFIYISVPVSPMLDFAYFFFKFYFNIFTFVHLKWRLIPIAWPYVWPWPRYFAVLVRCVALYTAGTLVWRTVIHVWYPCHVRPTSAWVAAFNSRNQPWLALQKWHKCIP